jgi:hypothetical protein
MDRRIHGPSTWRIAHGEQVLVSIRLLTGRLFTYAFGRPQAGVSP